MLFTLGFEAVIHCWKIDIDRDYTYSGKMSGHKNIISTFEVFDE